MKKFNFKKKKNRGSYTNIHGCPAEDAPLSKEEERFCKLKVSGMATYRAYYKAFKLPPPENDVERNRMRVKSTDLIRRPNLTKRVIDLWQKEKELGKTTKESIMIELGRIIHANILDYVYFDNNNRSVKVDPEALIDKNAGSAIQNLETTFDARGNEKLKIKLWSKEKALDMLAKIHKMYMDTADTAWENRYRQVIVIGDREVSF